jgi:malate dehydrogenase (oxaloacetate-decarboxylating)
MTRTLWLDEDGRWHTTLRGRQILSYPRLNRGTAFSYAERHELGLTGLVPPAHVTLDQQVARVYAQYRRQPGDLAKNVFLREIQDRNEVLFYKLLITHLTEMLPIVYTPTIGEAIKNYSHEYRRPRGVYLSVDQPELIEESLLDINQDSEDIDLIVATDAGAILGIGDWGVGGMDIAVGKLAVYTAAGGIHPDRTLPVMLDVGTDRQSLLDDPLYIGNRHPRVSPEDYDSFLDAFVDAASRLFPRAMLHWEDLGLANARRLLDRYRDRLLTFNDDIQGTGAVNLAAVLAAVRATGTQLHDHRIVIFGAGTAGTGIADQLRAEMLASGLSDADAKARFWAVDKPGLLTSDLRDLTESQRHLARNPAEADDWRRAADGRIGLAEVIAAVRPTILIGTSTRAGAFTEAIVKDLAAHVDRPVILPMSNPTELAEAVPADLIEWTDGRALVATGSPFQPVRYQGTDFVIGQANNALVFPGIGLGVVTAQASRITDGMLAAAAYAVANLTDSAERGAALLPPVEALRETSVAVAVAVAEAAWHDGVARAPLNEDLSRQVQDLMWQAAYRPIVPE